MRSLHRPSRLSRRRRPSRNLPHVGGASAPAIEIVNSDFLVLMDGAQNSSPTTNLGTASVTMGGTAPTFSTDHWIFNGSTQFVQINNHAAVRVAADDAKTIVAAYRPITVDGTIRPIVGKGATWGDGSDAGYYFGGQWTVNTNFGMERVSGSPIATSRAEAASPAGTDHVFMMRHFADGSFQIKLDDAPWGAIQTSFTSAGGATDSGDNAAIGRMNGRATGSYLNFWLYKIGWIDDAVSDAYADALVTAWTP